MGIIKKIAFSLLLLLFATAAIIFVCPSHSIRKTLFFFFILKKMKNFEDLLLDCCPMKETRSKWKWETTMRSQMMKLLTWVDGWWSGCWGWYGLLIRQLPHPASLQMDGSRNISFTKVHTFISNPKQVTMILCIFSPILEYDFNK